MILVFICRPLCHTYYLFDYFIYCIEQPSIFQINIFLCQLNETWAGLLFLLLQVFSQVVAKGQCLVCLLWSWISQASTSRIRLGWGALYLVIGMNWFTSTNLAHFGAPKPGPFWSPQTRVPPPPKLVAPPPPTPYHPHPGGCRAGLIMPSLPTKQLIWEGI